MFTNLNFSLNYRLRKGWGNRERMYLSQVKLLFGISLCQERKEKKCDLYGERVNIVSQVQSPEMPVTEISHGSTFCQCIFSVNVSFWLLCKVIIFQLILMESSIFMLVEMIKKSFFIKFHFSTLWKHQKIAGFTLMVLKLWKSFLCFFKNWIVNFSNKFGIEIALVGITWIYF